MSYLRSFLGGALLLSTFACVPGPGPEPEPEPETEVVDPAAARDAIDAVRNRELAAMNGGDADALAAVCTPDCEILPPGEPGVTGRDAVRSWAEALSRQFAVAGEYTSADVEVMGDVAIEHYTAVLTLTPKTDGEPIVQQNKGIHVYERRDDGSWLIAYDVWNESPTAPGEASE